MIGSMGDYKMTMTHEGWRKHPCYKYDPFADEIQPALLNSADINKYVDNGCLVESGDFDDKRLKTASYEMKFLGKLYHWNKSDDGVLRRCDQEIHDNEKVTLFRNSITYLWTKEKLLLPEYIAARFNLHIRHVHKGILLGTGPLVDPGFFGSLLIPLHNLTNNDYVLKGGEGIIWIEFTKVSTHKSWKPSEAMDIVDKLYDPKSFPEKKDLDSPDSYFSKSSIYCRGGVQSAFKGALDGAQTRAQDAEKSADDARKEIEQFNKRFRKFGWVAIAIGGVTILLTIAGVLFTGHNLISDTVSRVQDSRNREISTEIKTQGDKLKEFEADLKDVKTHLMNISESLNESNRQIEKPDNIEHHSETSSRR